MKKLIGFAPLGMALFITITYFTVPYFAGPVLTADAPYVPASWVVERAPRITDPLVREPVVQLTATPSATVISCTHESEPQPVTLDGRPDPLAGREIPPGWTRLGQLRNWSIDLLTVGPEWPAEPLLIGRANGLQGLYVSSNGGESWTLREGPGGQISNWVSVAPLRGELRMVFVLLRNPSDGSQLLCSSDDLGASWSEAVGGLSAFVNSRPVFSPSFAADGRAYFTANGKLWRTDDAGRTWQRVLLPAETLAQDVAFSPAFVNDRTVVLATTGGPLPAQYQGRSPRIEGDYASSPGMLISTDGGDHWQPSAEGMESGVVSYHNVQQVFFSPTYAQDSTLFAFAWGHRSSESAPLDEQVLLRSIDQGQSWTVVWQRPDTRPTSLRSPSSLFPTRFALGLSPQFSQDGVALMSVHRQGSTDGQTCTMYRTEDGGATWTLAIQARLGSSCAGVAVLYASGERIELYGMLGQAYSGGWPYFRLNPETHVPERFSPPAESTVSMAVSQGPPGNQTVFFPGTRGVIWGFGSAFGHD